MNRVTLQGRAANEPEIAKSEKGVVYCRFRLAVKGPYRGKDNPRKTEYFTMVGFKSVAQTIYNNLAKGAYCTIEGKLSQDVYIDNTGRKRESNSVIVTYINIHEWLKKSNTLKRLDSGFDDEMLVPREITQSLFKQVEISADDEDIPEELLGKDPFSNDQIQV